VLNGAVPAPSEVVSLGNLGALQFGVIDRHLGIAGHLPVALAVGDLDGDQDVDALLVDHAPFGALTPITTVLLNDGLGAWTASAGPTTAAHVSGVHLADVDGDGALDALLRTVSSGANFASGGSSALHRGDGAGGFLAPQSLPFAAVIAPAEDIDRDGDLDFAGIGTAGAFTFMENRGGTLHALASRALVRPSGEARLADLDSDGWPELVLPKQQGEAVGVRSMGPGLDIAEDEHHYTFPQPKEVGQGDLDGDGDGDFVAGDLYTRLCWRTVAPTSRSPCRTSRSGGTCSRCSSSTSTVISSVTSSLCCAALGKPERSACAERSAGSPTRRSCSTSACATPRVQRTLTSMATGARTSCSRVNSGSRSA